MPGAILNRMVIGVAAVAVMVAAAGCGSVRAGGTAVEDAAAGQSTPTSPPNPALARLIAEVTNVPTSVLAKAGDGDGEVTMMPTPITGSALRADGKPEVFYVGYQYCPYCATESWALIVALSRFGTFTGLSTIRSGNYRPFPYLDTWAFYRSAYASRYLAFVPVEPKSNVLTSPKANPQDASSYRTLEKLTSAQQAVLRRYDTTRAVPFLDFGNEVLILGTSFDPGLLQKKTWSQIAVALRNPGSPVGAAIDGAANYITAAICQLTGNQPARVCTPAIQKLLAS